MKFFNAVQIVALFAGGPFLINYVHEASFYAHTVLAWVLVGGYIAGFAGLSGAVAEQL